MQAYPLAALVQLPEIAFVFLCSSGIGVWLGAEVDEAAAGEGHAP